MEKKILDVTCGSRTIWFDKQHPAAVYCDARDEEYSAIWTSTQCVRWDLAVGKTVFLTREEAERALQEMEGKA